MRVAVALALLCACEPDAPPSPTWAADVAPILAASCVQCHAVPPLDGAPDRFVLDRPDGFVLDGGERVFGGRNMAEYVALRVADRSMPPRSPLTDRQIAILEAFAAQPPEEPDASGERPYGPRLGPPRDDNAAPTVRLSDAALDDDGFYRATIEIRDADDELVTGALEARGQDGGRVGITRLLASGRDAIEWDAAASAPGVARLVAVVDDGNGAIELEVGRVEVDLPRRAPRVGVTVAPIVHAVAPGPSPFDGFVDGAPDVVMSLSVTAVRGADQVALVDARPIEAGDPFPAEWPAGGLPAGDGWRIHATLSDGRYTRTATSRPFTVSDTTTELGWADVETTFARHCARCHFGPDGPLGLDRDFRGHAGVAAAAGEIYRRVVQQRNMPPVSARLGDDAIEPLSDEDRALLAGWLLGGAPCGDPGVGGCR